MAATPITTTVTELPESRVRVQAEVGAEEVHRRLEQAAKALGRGLKVPGFRAGKVPAQVVIQRVGREAVLDEAVRESLGRWYAAAMHAAHVAPVGEPSVDMEDLPAEGEPLRFTIEIGVRPKAALGDYKGLEVGRREPEIDDTVVADQIEQLRERSAKLETVERPAAKGDFVVMDYVGMLGDEPFAGGEGRDQMVELGSGRLVDSFETQLEGASAGEERTVEITFPDDYGAPHLAGQVATFTVTVKEVKEKQLPEIDDDLATDAGFDTLDELRADIRERLEAAERSRIEAEFREAALDTAVANAQLTVPGALVASRSHELWDQMVHSLSHQGISREAYLQIAQKTEAEVIEEGKDEAERALRREAVLAAIVEAEGIAPTDEEVLEALESSARMENTTAKKLFQRLESADRLDGLREDLAARKALDLVADAAKPISVGRAEAREKLWIPE